MSNSINGNNYIYHRDRGAIGVNAKSEEGQNIINNIGQYEHASIKEINGETYVIFDDRTYSPYGTVAIEQMDENTLTSLFLSGKLIVSEFEKGLSTKDIKNFETHTEGNKTVVTYTDNNGKKVTLKCNTDAAESQTDNNTVEVYNYYSLSPYAINDSIDLFCDVVGDGASTNCPGDKVYVFKDEVTIDGVTYKPPTEEDLKNYRDKKLSSVSFAYIYDAESGRVGRATRKSELTYMEQRKLELDHYDKYDDQYSDSESYYFSDADNWLNLRADTRYSILTIENLSAEQLMSLMGEDRNSFSSIPTSEIQKWADAHGVTDLKIEDIADENGVHGSMQKVTFTSDGQPYEHIHLSYENGRDYEYLIGLTGETMINEVTLGVFYENSKDITVVTNAQELKTAMQQNANIYIKNDIDMSGVEWETIPEFKGTIFGGFHTIKNLTVHGNGEAVGFIGVLDGCVKDLAFENATVINDNNEYPSCTGILAAKFHSTEGSGNVLNTLQCVENVDISNSKVTGGSIAGGLFGIKTGEAHVEDCSVKGCTVSGDYSTGGAVGYLGGSLDCNVENVTLNGGQWIGGMAGSADNYYYTAPNSKSYKDEYGITHTYTKKYIDVSEITGNVTGVTINGGYQGQETLGAGGVCGRISYLNENGTANQYGFMINAKNVKIDNAYATGDKIGWVCDLDADTGKVIRNGDLNYETQRGQVGRAGTTEWKALTTYGTSFNMQTILAYMDDWATRNGLTELSNLKGVYEDSNGVLYYPNWIATCPSDPDAPIGIGCTDYENSIDAYKQYVDFIHERGWTWKDGGHTTSTDGMNIYSAEMMYLTYLGAVEVVQKNDYREKNENRQLYYKTQDGSWHKLTTDTYAFLKQADDGAPCVFAHAIKQLKPAEVMQERGIKVEDMTYEEVFNDIGGLAGQPPYNDGHEKDDFDWVVEDIQPDPNVFEGVDIIDPNSEAAKRMTFNDYKDLLTLEKFIGLDLDAANGVISTRVISPDTYEVGYYEKQVIPGSEVYDEDGNLVTCSYENKWIKAPEEFQTPERIRQFVMHEDKLEKYDKRYTLLPIESGNNYYESSALNIYGGLELTQENFEKYKDSIVLYDKDQLVEKALDMLVENGWKLAAQWGLDSLDWAEELVSAMGGTGFKYTNGDVSKFNQVGSGCASYAYIDFNLNGKQYSIALYPNAGTKAPESAMVTKEQVNELLQYVSADEFKGIEEYWLTPMVTVDGEVQKYMFTWDSNILWEKDPHVAMETPKLGFRNFDELLNYWKENCKTGANPAELDSKKEADAAQKAAEQETEHRKEYAQTIIDRYSKKLEAYPGAAAEFLNSIANYKAQYLNASLKDKDFEAFANRICNEIISKGNSSQKIEKKEVTTKTVEETQNNLMNLVQLYLNISNPISKEEFSEKADEVVADVKAVEQKDETAAEQFIISKNEDYEPAREEAAKENGYVETEQGSCLYTPKESEDKDKTYVYEPVSSMFVEYTPDAKAADSVKQQIILQRALLMAQLMKLDFTVGYPLICKKDGVYYKFDESKMTFVKA